jgi:hypothetical protein
MATMAIGSAFLLIFVFEQNGAEQIHAPDGLHGRYSLLDPSSFSGPKARAFDAEGKSVGMPPSHTAELMSYLLGKKEDSFDPNGNADHDHASLNSAFQELLNPKHVEGEGVSPVAYGLVPDTIAGTKPHDILVPVSESPPMRSITGGGVQEKSSLRNAPASKAGSKQTVVPDPPAQKSIEKSKDEALPFGAGRNDQGGKTKPNDPDWFCPQHLPESKKGIEYWDRWASAS